jgi:hypothetical protein
MKIKDIVWEWQNAVVLEYKKNPEYVVKVAKNKEWVDDIKQEFKNHKLFYSSYQDWIYKWILTKDVKIPKIEELWKNDLFLIEKIDWETLYSSSARSVLEKKWIKFESWIKDKELDKTITEKYSIYQDDINTKATTDLTNALWLDYYDDYLWVDFYVKKDIDNNILNTLRYIKNDTWYIHDDIHSWNIMKSTKWTYIIDFGRIKKD